MGEKSETPWHAHLDTILFVVDEMIILLYRRGGIRHSDVIHRVGIYTNMLEKSEGLVEQAVYKGVSEWEKQSTRRDALGSAMTSRSGRPFFDHLST